MTAEIFKNSCHNSDRNCTHENSRLCLLTFTMIKGKKEGQTATIRILSVKQTETKLFKEILVGTPCLGFPLKKTVSFLNVANS